MIMKFPKQYWKIWAVCLLGLPLHAQVAHHNIVQKISVGSGDPLQLQVQTSVPVTPQAQIITDPERLVIDIPNAAPAAGLQNQSLNRNEATRLRVGLFSVAPPVTRIVLDLNAPQWYRIEPVASGFTVTLGPNSQNTQPGAALTPTIGWVSGKSLAAVSANRVDPFVVRKAPASVPVSGANVRFADGLLEIHARNTTLSEVLFQIQKQTGAEIAIPAGTEQESVIADFGPAPASEVLSQLLNGTDLNFVVVGSEANPKILRNVILSRKTVGYAENTNSYIPPPVGDNIPSATNIPPGDTPDLDPQPEQNIQAPQEPPPTGEAPPG